jgi:hypothetical protein
MMKLLFLVTKSSLSRKLSGLANHSQFTRLITDFTRITSYSKTIIDLVFVSKPETISSSGVHSLGLSDHCLIYVIRKHKQIKSPSRYTKTRSYTGFDEQKFVDSINKENWDAVHNCKNVNSAWDAWKGMFDKVCDLHAPVREKRVKGWQPEWITSEFLSLCKDRDYYYGKAHKTNNSDYWKKAKSFRNKANNMRFFLKKSFYSKSIADNVSDSRKLWATLKKLLPNKSSPTASSVKTSNDTFTSSAKDTAIMSLISILLPLVLLLVKNSALVIMLIMNLKVIILRVLLHLVIYHPNLFISIYVKCQIHVHQV